MPSNHYMYVCVPCRNVIGHTKACPECGKDRELTYKWSPPKKNNDRAWKRIAKGEWLWDRRRVYRNRYFRNRQDTVTKYDHEDIEVAYGPHVIIQRKVVPGSEREVTNYGRLPDIDMGG